MSHVTPPELPNNNSTTRIKNIFLVYIPNGIFLVLYFPMLFATMMSFDAPGSGEHWVHLFFVFSTVALGPLCLVGIVSRRFRYVGLIGIALFFVSIFLLMRICDGEFTCSQSNVAPAPITTPGRP
jgi:hypothetical protein